MPRQDDMSNEKPPKRLLPLGWRSFLIKNAIEGTSKAGNAKIVATIMDTATKYEKELHMVAEPGKRWLLKKLLDACGIEGGQDGVYDWDVNDLKGQTVWGYVEHEDNEYINRAGETVKAKQHRINDFKEASIDDLIADNQDPKPEEQQEAWPEDTK